MEVSTIVQSHIGMEDRGCSVVEVRTVVVVPVDAEGPVAACIIDRTIEILYSEESSILAATENVAEVVVTYVEQIVVVVDCIVVAEHYVVDNLVDIPEVVIVDFENVLELSTTKS